MNRATGIAVGVVAVTAAVVFVAFGRRRWPRRVVVLSAGAVIAGFAAPVALGALHVSFSQARAQIRRELFKDDAVYRVHVGHCARISSAKVRCRAHVRAEDASGDYDCHVLGTVTVISVGGRAFHRTRTHSPHCSPSG